MNNDTNNNMPVSKIFQRALNKDLKEGIAKRQEVLRNEILDTKQHIQIARAQSTIIKLATISAVLTESTLAAFKEQQNVKIHAQE